MGVLEFEKRSKMVIKQQKEQEKTVIKHKTEMCYFAVKGRHE